MKKVLIFFFILILLASMAAGVVYYVLNAAWITERIVPRVFHMQVPDITMERLTLDTQHFSPDGSLTIERLMCILRDRTDRNGIHIDRITVSSLYPLLGLPQAGDQIGIILHKANIMSSYLRVVDVNVTTNVFLKKKSVGSIAGNVDITRGSYDGWRFSDASARFQGTPDDIVVNKIHTAFYGGTITGNVHVRPFAHGAYTVDLLLADVNVAQLARDKPELFSQIEGTTEMVIEITGTARELHSITVRADVIKDSKIDAALIGPLLQYVPNSTQRKEIELLIHEKKKIPLDTTVLAVKNTDSETVAATIQLVSKKYNLDINLTVDFHIEGGIINLLGLFQKQIQPDVPAKG